MNIFASAGITFGIILGVVIVLVFYKFSNTDRRAKTEYDERQRMVRGTAYCAAFYTLAIYETVMLVLAYGEIQLPVKPYILHAAGLFLSVTVLACYSLWKGAYWGLNNNKKRSFWLFIVLFILNAIPVIGALTRGGMVENGMLGSPFINVMVLFMMIAMGIVILIRGYMDRKAAEE